MTSVSHSGSIEDLFHLGYPAIIFSNVFFLSSPELFCHVLNVSFESCMNDKAHLKRPIFQKDSLNYFTSSRNQ